VTPESGIFLRENFVCERGGHRDPDFLIIGAQKAGTTALYEYLRVHPGIYIPPEKEAPFFLVPEREEKGTRWYMREFFAEAPEQSLWGTSTPQYMCALGASRKISETWPKAKIIAILRDPIKRAYSHFRMCVRRGIESRTFTQAIADELESTVKLATELSQADDIDYLARGLYSVILREYLGDFDRSQVLILFSSDLSANPEASLQEIYEFLEIPSFEPKNLGRRYHVGGLKQKLPWLRKVRHLGVVARLWDRIPAKHRRRIAFRIDKWNTAPSEADDCVLSEEKMHNLTEFFAKDATKLSELIGREIPWIKDWQIARDQR
jgi:hypothetical protein